MGIDNEFVNGLKWCDKNPATPTKKGLSDCNTII